MKTLLQNLLKLQQIDFSDRADEAATAEIRAAIPAQILGHYDRLVARGKKGVALVRNQVCTGCHMRIPIGTINTLMQGQDIQLCDSCGRYLALPEETAQQPAPEPAPAAKPPRKPRKKKVVQEHVAV